MILGYCFETMASAEPVVQPPPQRHPLSHLFGTDFSIGSTSSISSPGLTFEPSTPSTTTSTSTTKTTTTTTSLNRLGMEIPQIRRPTPTLAEMLVPGTSHGGGDSDRPDLTATTPVSTTNPSVVPRPPPHQIEQSSSSSPVSGPSPNNNKRKSGQAGLDRPNGLPPRPVKRRASKACQCCRARKVRCNVTEHGAPCTNCRLDEVECVVSESRRKK